MIESRESVTAPLLKDLLIAGARGDLTLPEYPPTIELGTLLPECDRLMELTYADPEHQEKAVNVYAWPNNTLGVDAKESTSTTIAGGMSVTMRTVIRSRGLEVPRQFRQDKYLVGILHTHGIDDVPQSPRDLADLFAHSDSLVAEVMSGVITPKRRIFIFRGRNTPQWEKDFIEEKVAFWNTILNKRILHHLRPWMSKEQTDDINNRALTALVNQIAATYDLQIYSGSSADKVIKKGPLQF